jgi:hypothetical protein
MNVSVKIGHEMGEKVEADFRQIIIWNLAG